MRQKAFAEFKAELMAYEPSMQTSAEHAYYDRITTSLSHCRDIGEQSAILQSEGKDSATIEGKRRHPSFFNRPPALPA
jgi:hypothetical protein